MPTIEDAKALIAPVPTSLKLRPLRVWAACGGSLQFRFRLDGDGMRLVAGQVWIEWPLLDFGNSSFIKPAARP